MKILHILEANLPDPSDYRPGDESNPRSPHFDGDDDDGARDPSGFDDPRQVRQKSGIFDYMHDEDRKVDPKTGVTTYWGAYGTPEARAQMLKQIQAGATEVYDVQMKEIPPDAEYDDTSYELTVQYGY